MKRLLIALLVAPAILGAQGTAAPSNAAARPSTFGGPEVVDRVVAVVGSSSILWSDVQTEVNQQRAQGLKLPPDSAGQYALARNALNDLVDQEILVQKAADLKITVSNEDVASTVDRQIKGVRAQFQSDAEYKAELKKAGFGTPEEYRRTLFDQYRRRSLQQKAFAELQKRARPASVTEEEVNAAFEKARDQLQKRPATISFRQIVVPPRASEAARARARAKADSILVELKKGGDFETIAKRESMDPGTAKLGGDLGWNRRGSGLVPEFEQMMFSLAPGQLSPVIQTSFGYHIIRVDRVQPSEVKARHILIAPLIDSSDVAAARIRADSVAAQWRKGVPFDSLVARYHDPAEEKGVLQPFPLDSLPPSYRTAITGQKAGSITDPFALTTPNGLSKFAVMQIVARTEPGEYSLAEVRERLRSQLALERSTRELLDELRRSTFVSLRL